jgi:hypothetical protein
MNSFMRVVEIAWLAVAAVSLSEVYFRWNTNRYQAYMFGGFFLIAAFMYFFRKRQRIKYISRKHNQQK